MNVFNELSQMDHDNDCEQMISECESISIPPFLEDQGDVFQCGRCKQNFYSILDFLSHKKEHAAEQRICHMLNVYPANIVALTQPSNEIWILKEDNFQITPVDECETNLLVTSNTVVDLEDQQHFLQHDFIAGTVDNLKYKQDSSLMFIADKETTNESVNSLSCLTCGECFECAAELTTHSQCHLSIETHFQEDTPTYTATKSNVETGIRVPPQTSVKSQKKYFQCLVCGRIFSNKCFLRKHVLSHKVWPDSVGKTLPKESSANERSYLCPYCQQIFNTHSNLRTHLKEHKHQKVYKCIQDKCMDMFVDLESLLSHINITHDYVEYHCHVCSTVFTSLQESAAHQQTHSGDEALSKKVYQCVYCKAVFTRNYRLKHHLDTADHVNKCRHCNKSFVSERSLRQHLLLHNKSISYKCDLCPASFKLKHYLSSHLATHSENKQFSCDICFKDFKRKDLLSRHSKVHQPNQWKQCPYRNQLGCMLEFSRTDKLKKHIKTHSKKINIEMNESPLEITIVPVAGDGMI